MSVHEDKQISEEAVFAVFGELMAADGFAFLHEQMRAGTVGPVLTVLHDGRVAGAIGPMETMADPDGGGGPSDRLCTPEGLTSLGFVNQRDV
ncbi:hypothetical protein ACFWBS_28340 [Streptomyces mirabilis]|uniref:hypothetical protein n=1 Tax=Streptomyces mirabilis TaxID=68239 RepID=UPI0036686F7A